jgi:hypothetical protein
LFDATRGVPLVTEARTPIGFHWNRHDIANVFVEAVLFSGCEARILKGVRASLL